MSETLGLLKIIDDLRKPMHVTGEATFSVSLAGDWYSVIRMGDQREKWRDHLLNQMPHDEEDAEFRVYRLQPEDGKELLAIINACEQAKLRWSIECNIKSDKATAWATMRCHYARKQESIIRVKAREVTA